jgi:hypothetical protein
MIDPSKYGTPVSDDKGFYSKKDVSKYGTPATPAPTPKTPVGDKGIKGFATGFAKSLLGGATQTASMLQGAGQRIMSGISGQKFEDIKKTTGVPGLRAGSEEFKQQQEMLKRVGKAEKIGGVVETIAEFAIPTNIANKGYKSIKTLDWLKNTPETITKLEEQAASLAGRVKKGLNGAKKILASAEEKRAAQILEGKISSNVTKNPQIIEKEIAKRGGEVEKYLNKNKIVITADKLLKSWIEKRKAIEKSLDKSQLKAFDDQFRMFVKQFSDTGITNTYSDLLYKGLKQYEQNVAKNLPRGMATLTDATGIASAKIQGAKSVRKFVRDLLGELHPEFKPKMYDLASLYDVLDTALTKSRQLSGTTLSRFAKNNPLIKNALLIGGGIVAGKALGNKKEASFSNINQIGND